MNRLFTVNNFSFSIAVLPEAFRNGCQTGIFDLKKILLYILNHQAAAIKYSDLT